MNVPMPEGWYSDADGNRHYWDGSAWSDLKYEGAAPAVAPEAVVDAPAHDTDSASVPASTPAPRRRPQGRTALVVASALVGGLLFHGGIGAVGVGVFAASQATIAGALTQARDEKLAAEKAAEEAAAAAAAEKLAAEQAIAEEQAWRESLVLSLETSVLEDAREMFDEGYLEEAILEASCMPADGSSMDALTDMTTGAFSCIAVTEKDGDEMSGYSYTATVGWADGQYTWQLE